MGFWTPTNQSSSSHSGASQRTLPPLEQSLTQAVYGARCPVMVANQCMEPLEAQRKGGDLWEEFPCRRHRGLSWRAGRRFRHRQEAAGQRTPGHSGESPHVDRESVGVKQCPPLGESQFSVLSPDLGKGVTQLGVVLPQFASDRPSLGSSSWSDCYCGDFLLRALVQMQTP